MLQPYSLFSVISHETSHSVVITQWANRSIPFKNGMECLNEHFNRTCDLLEEGSCNSGAQTFTEDGSDILGQRINYEFFTRNYKDEELNKIVFDSDSLSVTREQAFFYLFGTTWCLKSGIVENHTDVHSNPQVRVNGVVTQMPEFSKAFSCTPEEAMFTAKKQTCNLFGPDSK
ncbi:hypothetical protein PENTCL1PPCAC_29061 [Pristionchus entomophagus]|uniref:Peptidase M13 C-terminal domain-containing protein n=1 Tax=Pristionchus entomophagus TaxID=358040 RepID=A0AAV5UJU9_9BILA|nr:hypothetical protein PENTCL1PPCAC_29061 [Pristionchus entomophagus]